MTDSTAAIFTELVEISRRLGNVEGQNKEIIAEQGKAATSRREMYRMHEENRADIALVRVVAEEVKSDVKEMKPVLEATEAVCKKVVDEHEPAIKEWRLFKIRITVSALAIAGFAGAVVTGAIHLIVLFFSNLGSIKDALQSLMQR
jgi:predicted transcriptional regulator